LNDKIIHKIEKEKEKKIKYRKSKNKGVAFILGGETVVRIETPNSIKNRSYNIHVKNFKTGQGGRNQESILASIPYLNSVKLNDFTILCCGTDGIDGNSYYAGGVVTPTTIDLSNNIKINLSKYLESHDSSSYLKKVKSVIKTGRTGTNVNDISVVCKIL
jgi:glycerate-2-kinase